MRPGLLFIALLALLLALADPALAGPRQGELWRWTAQAVGQIVDGDLVSAYRSLQRARAGGRPAELDALAGLVALQGGEPAAALRQIGAAAARRSDQPLVYYWAGRAELAAGHAAAAVKRFEQALAIGGDRPVLRVGHALALLAAGQKDRALESLRLAAIGSADLLDPSLYPTASEGAVELLELFFRGFPARIELLRTQGHLLWRAGRVLAAGRRFRGLLAASPDDADALQMLGRAELALGEEREAKESIERALRLAGGLPQALAARGELLLDQGQAARAVADLQRAADALPRDARLLLRLAEACVAAERPDCARRFFSYALRRDGSSAAACLGLGLLEQQAGEHGKARALFARAMALEPGSSRHFEAAAQLEATHGDRARAPRLLAEARRLAGPEREQRRRLEAARQEGRRQTQAMRELAAAPRCETKSCRAALARVPEPARLFAEAHLALKRGDGSRARELLGRLLPRLRARALLDTDPTLIETVGRTGSGARYTLRSLAPLVPSARFR